MAEIPRRHALGGLLILNARTAFGSEANSAVSFGIIGTGGRGRYVGTHMAKDPRARLAAICDVFPDRLDQARTSVPGADKATAFRNYQDLLAMKELDAVLIATPVFLHPEHFEAAVGSGKHIYCEKPAGADVPGVKRLMRAADSAPPALVIQFGFQQRFSPEYLRGMERLRKGDLGELSMMMSFWVLGGVPPRTFKSPYSPEEQKLRHWGWWSETSGGPIVEQDCHGVDTLNWFAGKHPAKAVGTGGLRYPLAYGDWTSDHHNIVYTYEGGLEGWLISVKHAAGFRDVRERFFGSKAMLETARTYYKLHGPVPTSPLRNADDLADRSLVERVDSKREITIDAVEHFFGCIAGKRPFSMARDAAESTLTSILGRMAYEHRREISWDEMLREA
jgi:myo-inositol 2-dehydrogenase/D-chiro-inositol 1-dehydrogenase